MWWPGTKAQEAQVRPCGQLQLGRTLSGAPHMKALPVRTLKQARPHQTPGDVTKSSCVFTGHWCQGYERHRFFVFFLETLLSAVGPGVTTGRQAPSLCQPHPKIRSGPFQERSPAHAPVCGVELCRPPRVSGSQAAGCGLWLPGAVHKATFTGGSHMASLG